VPWTPTEGAHDPVDAPGLGVAPRASSAPGAIVIGGDYQGLGVVRSLGRRGIRVLVLDDRWSISRHSRYASGFVRVRDLRAEESTIGVLRELAESGLCDGWVVFPTREETVAALARHRHLLAPLRIPTPGWEVARWAHDKRNTYEIAGQLGIPVPRFWRLGDPGDLSKVDGDPPYVIKPAIKERFMYETGAKAWRADTRPQLAERVRAAASLIGIEEVIVQELIPGGGEAQLAYCAFFKQDAARASMVVQRLRQHPQLFGRASTFVRTAHQPELEALSERLLRAIGYYGLVEVEYKRDPRDGAVKLLDVNARTWGYHSLGQRAGVDFPYLLWADQQGLSLPDVRSAPPGVTWVRLATDVPSAALALARGALPWRDYLGSVRRADTEAVLCADDPAPWFAELAVLPCTAAAELCARRLGLRAARACRPRSAPPRAAWRGCVAEAALSAPGPHPGRRRPSAPGP